jgi:LysM repeat protein
MEIEGKYIERYITQEDWEYRQRTGYEGFVIGLGYAKIVAKMIPAPNLRGVTYIGNIPPALNQFGIFEYQYLETSPEAVAMSLKNAEQYTVQAGDKLELLARKFNVSVDELVRLNGLSNKDLIKKGDVLVLRNPQKAFAPIDARNLIGRKPVQNFPAKITNFNAGDIAKPNRGGLFSFLDKMVGGIAMYGFGHDMKNSPGRITRHVWGSLNLAGLLDILGLFMQSVTGKHDIPNTPSILLDEAVDKWQGKLAKPYMDSITVIPPKPPLIVADSFTLKKTAAPAPYKGSPTLNRDLNRNLKPTLMPKKVQPFTPMTIDSTKWTNTYTNGIYTYHKNLRGDTTKIDTFQINFYNPDTLKH